jgi:peptidoglycan DL-endopeptidase CwlO
MRILPWFTLISIALTSSVFSDDDTWHNVYHTLRRFGHNVKDTFTGDDNSSSSKTRTAHQSSSSRHSSKHHTTSSASEDDEESSPKKSDSKKSKSSAAKTSDSEQNHEKAKLSPSPSASPKETASPSPTPSSSPTSNASPAVQTSPLPPAQVASIKPAQLRAFEKQPARVQQLLRDSLNLTERNLAYKYGSADPAQGGLDCSGFIYYTLSKAGIKDVPRDSSEQYMWVRKNSDFHAVLSRNADTFELDDLKPGDLMFWSGTYKVERDVPISHVMIYLGRETESGKRVMVGASDGRTYEGKQRYGVSVFDFKLPSGKPYKSDPDLTAKFEGYATIPGFPNERLADATFNPEKTVAAPEPSPSESPEPAHHRAHKTSGKKKRSGE